MPVTFARVAESVTGLKRPLPAFFIAAARFLPAAVLAFDFGEPFLRLPPGYFNFLAFFFFFFFFFFLAFFFAGFFVAFFAFFFFAAVRCVRASDFFEIFFTTTVVSVWSTIGSSRTMSANGCVALEP